MKTVPEQIITPENLSRFCYTNAPLLKRDLRGVILTFHGRGEPGFLSHSPFSKELAEKGIIQIFPYYGPWAWMNSGAVKITDALVSAVYERWAGGKDVPLVCEGGSMGGLAALIYPVLGRRKPAAAAALTSSASWARAPQTKTPSRRSMRPNSSPARRIPSP